MLVIITATTSVVNLAPELLVSASVDILGAVDMVAQDMALVRELSP